MYHETQNMRNAGQLLCRHETYGAEYPSDVSVPVPRVFHYVTSEEMYFIDHQWYDENHV